jgi:ankyrin repeat protein
MNATHPIPIPKAPVGMAAIIKHSFGDLLITNPHKAKRFLSLRYAVELGDVALICNAVHDAEDIIDVLDETGHTLLMWEAALGNISTVKMLLWIGANPTIISPIDDMTALAFAIMNNHQDIANILRNTSTR